MPWSRSNNSGVVSCSGQDNVVNNFMGTSQKVLIRVSNEAGGGGGDVTEMSRRQMWQRNQHMQFPGDHMCCSTSLEGEWAEREDACPGKGGLSQASGKDGA